MLSVAGSATLPQLKTSFEVANRSLKRLIEDLRSSARAETPTAVPILIRNDVRNGIRYPGGFLPRSGDAHRRLDGTGRHYWQFRGTFHTQKGSTLPPFLEMMTYRDGCHATIWVYEDESEARIWRSQPK